MTKDVFISHSARDKPDADAVCATLEARGISCWVAPRDIRPGMEWGSAIVEAIDGARVMLLLFSAHSNSSPQISREIERAVHKNLIVIPVRIEDVTPAGNLEYFLGTPQWLDAIAPPFAAHLDGIADSVAFWLNRAQGETHDVNSRIAVAPIAAVRSSGLLTSRRSWRWAVVVVGLIVALGTGGFLATHYYLKSLQQQAEKLAQQQAAEAQQRAQGAEQSNPANQVTGAAPGSPPPSNGPPPEGSGNSLERGPVSLTGPPVQLVKPGSVNLLGH